MHIDREDWERFKAQQDAAEAEIERLTALNAGLLFWLKMADGYLEADDAEERDDPGNIRRDVRVGIRAIVSNATP